jgi:hypothetical protein
VRIDLQPSDSWTALSDQYRAELAKHLAVFAEPGLQVQVYMNYAQALWEITQSLAKLFSHKKTIALAGKGELLFEPIATAFSEDGFTIKTLTRDEMENPSSWFEAVQTDLLFLLYIQDDAVTGRIQNNESLLAAVKDKRVFKIAVSHSGHQFQPLERPSPFEVRVLSLGPDRALMVAGERARVVPSVARVLPWKTESSQAIAAQLSFSNADHRAQILEFEAKLPEGFKAYFAPTDARVFDRAVIYSTEFDGSAITDELARLGGFQLASPGHFSELESTSPCRWENPRIKDWLLAREGSEDVVRGLVIIDAKAVTPDLSAYLTTAARNLRKLQNG